MRKIATMIAGAGALVLVSGNAHALCPPNTIGPLNGAAAPGNPLVGGPVDAAVDAAMTPAHGCAYVIEEEIPPAVSEGPAVADEPQPETGPLRTSRENQAYVTAYVDGEPVLVDPDTRAVVEVMK
jgi:hypothetical protein